MVLRIYSGIIRDVEAIPMGTWFQRLRDDIRTNLVGLLMGWLLGGGLITALIAWLRARADTPISAAAAVAIFATAGLLAVGILVLYLAKKRRGSLDTPSLPTRQWTTFALTALVILLFFWVWSLQQTVHRLQVEMRRFVLPRELTNNQIKAFGQYLASHSQPHELKIKYILGDAESERYANDFAAAFREGNWVPTMFPIDPTVIDCRQSVPGNESSFSCNAQLRQMENRLQGVQLEQTGPNPPQPSTIEEKLHPQPYLNQTIVEAMNAAGIPPSGGSYSFNNDPLNTITLFVGLRPRDKFGVLPAKLFQRQKEDLNDVSDDDF